MGSIIRIQGSGSFSLCQKATLLTRKQLLHVVLHVIMCVVFYSEWYSRVRPLLPMALAVIHRPTMDLYTIEDAALAINRSVSNFYHINDMAMDHFLYVLDSEVGDVRGTSSFLRHLNVYFSLLDIFAEGAHTATIGGNQLQVPRHHLQPDHSLQR